MTSGEKPIDVNKWFTAYTFVVSLSTSSHAHLQS
jgi:hypothetical protein